MNELRMKRLSQESEELAIKAKYLVRLSRDDKRLESLFATAQEAFLLARKMANEIREGETVG